MTISNHLQTAKFVVLTTLLIFVCPAFSLAAPPTTVYAGTGGGLLKSTDGGMTWTNLSPAGGFPGMQVTSVAIDPVNAQIIYAGASGNLYKTTDGGTHWTAINTGLPAGPRSNFSAIVIDPTNPNTIYAASGEALQGSVYKSTNAGASWTDIGTGRVPLAPPCMGCTPAILSVDGLAIDPTNPQTLYLAGTDGTESSKTTDGGNTWAALPSGGSQNVVVDPASPSTVWFSGAFGIAMTTDGGSTFTSFLTPSQIGQILVVNGFALDPNNPATVYAGAGETLYKSTTTPPAFAAYGAGIPAGVDIRALAVDPANSQTVYAGTLKGVFVSTDGGGSWTGPTTSATDYAAWTFAMQPNTAQGATFQATETAVTQLINSVNSPAGAFSCFVLQGLDHDIPLFENLGLLSSAQGQALLGQMQPVLAAPPCK